MSTHTPQQEPNLINTPESVRQFHLTGYETDRSLAMYEHYLGFSLEEMPQDGKLLVLGSGLLRKFERQVHDLRPDIQIDSIDPSLKNGLKEHVRFNQPKTTSDERVEELMDQYFDPDSAYPVAIINRENRTEWLPFDDETYDEAVALFSLPMYSDADEVPFIMNEVLRVLKKGGTARLFPFSAPKLENLKLYQRLSFQSFTFETDTRIDDENEYASMVIIHKSTEDEQRAAEQAHERAAKRAGAFGNILRWLS